MVCIAIEEHIEDTVKWRLHTQRGFLPAGAETHTPPVNPIHLDIQRSKLTHNGTFKYSCRRSWTSELASFIRLQLRMCQILRKCSPEKGGIFHALSSSTVQNLHPARYIPNTPRLLCVMANADGDMHWETFGLSDFIRPSKVVLKDESASTFSIFSSYAQSQRAHKIKLEMHQFKL